MSNIYEKVIAVVGVSEREQKFGYKIFRDLIKHNFNVIGINPRGGQILGRKIYKDLRDVGSLPDLVITVVAPQITEKIVEVCAKVGIREIWMQPGSESDTAIEKAKKYGIAVTHNACFMLQHGIW